MGNKLFVVVPAVVFIATWHVALAQENVVREKENGWSSFGQGSWVILKTTRKIDGKVDTEREKKVVAESEASHVNVNLFRDKDGKWSEHGTALMSFCRAYQAGANGFKQGTDRKETCEIAGKKLECLVQEHGFAQKGEQRSLTLKVVVWRQEKVKIPNSEIPNDANMAVPRDAVKIQVAYTDDRGHPQTTSNLCHLSVN